jgi:RNA polymerase sigma-70 factor (ECF subfamily)
VRIALNDNNLANASAYGSAAGADDQSLIAALRVRDEQAFVTLVERYHAALQRLALAYVADSAVAAEVVQETWLGVLHGIDRFEGRSSLCTWICRILTNTAKTRGKQERRQVPFSTLAAAEAGRDDPSVPPERFATDGPWPGHWTTAAEPRPWSASPEATLLADETRGCIRAAIGTLPEAQREVITLRDIEGWETTEVCVALCISEANQRVLLHRGRAKVRGALEAYFDGKAGRAQ